MTPSELKYHVEGTGSHFFERSSMKFFGDTMSNYDYRSAVIQELNGDEIEVWELRRRRPVKHNLCSSTYFCKATFQRVFPEKV